MATIIDLTHTFTHSMPVYPFDEPAIIKKTRTLVDNGYTDWQLSSGMHVGTHIDGPGHFTQSDVLLSDIPVERFIGKGYLIDARSKALDAALLEKLPDEQGMIVLIVTGMSTQWGSPGYFTQYPVMSSAFAHTLVQRKISLLGIDSCSPDRHPFEAHKILLQNDVLIIENLTNLERLVGVQDFSVIALPLKTETDSALARVVAVVED